MIVNQRWIVGQAEDCDVRVADEYVSGHHCEVVLTTLGGYLVRDLGSTNGTRIRHADGTLVKVSGWTPIVLGMTLVLSSRSEIPWTPAT